MERKSLHELKDLINEDIKKQHDFIEQFKYDNNPQVEIMVIQAEARKDTLEDIARYIISGYKKQFGKK